MNSSRMYESKFLTLPLMNMHMSILSTFFQEKVVIPLFQVETVKFHIACVRGSFYQNRVYSIFLNIGSKERVTSSSKAILTIETQNNSELYLTS
jgi:hypothetical protein